MNKLVALVLLFGCLVSARGEEFAPPEKYAPAVKALHDWLEKEVAAKRIPALSIALVDDQTILWADGFGHLDEQKTHAAGPHTLYRVGSVSKPITALLLMKYVELGLINLDAPIQDYLPEFRPTNKTGKKITLRQMLCHRSGLVREPPIGNYFDTANPSLADTVMSLNKTELIYTPETMTAYSNAALSVVGYTLEKTQQEPFARLIQKKLLDPMGLKESSFDPAAELRRRLPKAVMWTYQGREFPAPTFDLGMSPAGSLYSTVADHARILQFLFARGKGASGQLLKPETLEKMWKIQFPKEGEKAGFGLGFFVSEFEGKRRIGHGGAVYGFATELAGLPDDKLGVIVCSARDVSNGVTRRIADLALRHLLAVRAGKPLPAIETTEPVGAELARSLAGRYRSQDKTLELYQRDGRLWLFPPRTGIKIELRKLGKDLVTDDALGFGQKLEMQGAAVLWNKEKYERTPTTRPIPVSAKFAGLIGEYGPDHNVVYILEKDNALHALIEWVFLYPLKEVSPTVYEFPDYGLYHGDKIVFSRDASGHANQVEAANMLFKRRRLPLPEETFKIEPVRPLAELRKAALAATPPDEKNVFLRKPDLVELTSLEPTIKLDIRYASDNNFLGGPFYTSPKAMLQRPAAEAVTRAHQKLAKHGFGLLIHDAYRPWFVTKMFYDAVPPRYYGFVADPQKGSRHNRGCAVDLSLYNLKTGTPVNMIGGYDEFTDRSSPDYLGGTSYQRWMRDLLREVMEEEGFNVFENEWWHFDYRDWRQYPIMNTGW